VVAVTSKDGTSIALHRDGNGPHLVLVHGTAANHTRWATIRPRFEDEFTVTAIDRRGRGDSGDSPDYSIVREIEDVVAVVEALGGPVLLFGHSYGAIIALEAAMQTDAVSGAILYEPPIVDEGESVYAPEMLGRMEEALAAGDRSRVVEMMMTEIVRVPPEHLETLKASPAWSGRTAAAHTIPRELRAQDAYRFDAARASRLKKPVLLLLGGDSPAFFGNAIATLKRTLPNARTVVMPGQQHIAHGHRPRPRRRRGRRLSPRYWLDTDGCRETTVRLALPWLGGMLARVNCKCSDRVLPSFLGALTGPI
jgi:pimeloyl-ACP methyl ester carboxylesterase